MQQSGIKRRFDSFEVNHTPKAKKCRESDPPPILMLAPFALVPKVCFNNVKLNTTALSSVLIKNPSDLPTEIKLLLTDEIVNVGLKFNNVYFNLEPCATALLEIQWTPKTVVQWRGKVSMKHLNGDKKFSCITIACSSVDLQQKKILRKKVCNNNVFSPSVFGANRNRQRNVKFIDSQVHVPPCNIVTPIRRETYEVVKPTYFAPSIQIVSPHSHTLSISQVTVDEEIETNFCSTQLVSSSPQPKENGDFKSNRAPLKEFNYSTVLRKEEIPLDKLTDTYNTSELNFDRDSLESPGINKDLTLHNEKTNLSYISDFKNKTFTAEPVAVKNNTSFYLIEKDTPNITFTLDDSLMNKDTTCSLIISDNATNYIKAVISPNKKIGIGVRNHRIHESVTFEISPAKPIFRKKHISSPSLQRRKEIKKVLEEKNMITQEALGFPADNDLHSLYDQSDYLIHPYGITTIGNPFARKAVHPREWLDKLELELIKWLNSLLTPPIELGSIVQGVDVKKLWDQSTATSLKIAPSRESASKDYVLSDGSRMVALRKVAVSLARSDEIRSTLYNIKGKIGNGFLSVKDDISLYHNQGARVKLVQMCMYYNPLWLRIALEVMYEQVIPLHENNIHRGLVYFLKNHFLSNHEIIEKNKHSKSNHPMGPAFILEMNNFIVLKFFTLIYFLDQAKTKKIIPYDPCLFCKDSPIKESEGMLNEFIKEFLKCIGKFKRTLKHLGYKLEYRQTYLDEFDYGLSSHLDLRDGVRLTRAMETILKNPTYSQKLWTPAHSRVQKIHNVQLAFSLIINSGYEIGYDISPSDIVNGHREKIFSLLWQILHEFLAPRYQSAAKTIQSWWRKRLLKILLKRRIVYKKNIVIIQAIVRMFLVRRRLKKMHTSAIQIQRWFRNISVCTEYIRDFRVKRNAAYKIQIWYLSILKMRKDMKSFALMRQSALLIQTFWRHSKLMIHHRNEFLQIKNSTIKIQGWFRSIRVKRKEREKFLIQKNAAIKIQNWYRSILVGKLEYQQFLIRKESCTKIQIWYRNIIKCRIHRQMFLKQRNACIIIQRAYKKYRTGKKCREAFISQKNATITIQRYFRSYLLMKAYRNLYRNKREAVIVIQKWFRCSRLTKLKRKYFLLQRNSALIIQRWYRLSTIRRIEHKQFLAKRNAALVIQHSFVAYLERKRFLKLKMASIKIQCWYRHIINKRRKREVKLLQKLAVIKIEKWYLVTRNLRYDRNKFNKMRSSAIIIQRWYRSIVRSREAKKLEKLDKAATLIQATFRGYIVRKKCKRPEKSLTQNSPTEGLKLSNIFCNSLIVISYNYQHRDLFDVITAYKNIEVCTRFSPVLCLNLASHDFFFDRLFYILNQSLREGPHLEIYKYGLNIIIKLLQFDKTMNSILFSLDTYDGYNILITLMGKFIDKNTHIFCLAATVLWLLLTINPSYREQKKVIDKLDVRRLSYFHKKTMFKKCGVKQKYIPSQYADWGYFDNPIGFLSVRTAIEEIMKHVPKSLKK